jgi:magnesium chelatase family protein
MQIQSYRSRVSGPLLDRIDIQVEVRAVPYRDLAAHATAESSAALRAIRIRSIKHTRLERGLHQHLGRRRAVQGGIAFSTTRRI